MINPAIEVISHIVGIYAGISWENINRETGERIPEKTPNMAVINSIITFNKTIKFFISTL
jgi:hypothetical protein